MEVQASDFLWPWWLQLIEPFAQQERAVQADILLHQLINLLGRAHQEVGLLTQWNVDFLKKATKMEDLV